MINYEYIRDQDKWPAAAKAQTVASADSGQNTAGKTVQTQHVVWTGAVTPETTGEHKFRLYSSSYVKVFADGKLVLERWRQNWNPGSTISPCPWSRASRSTSASNGNRTRAISPSTITTPCPPPIATRCGCRRMSARRPIIIMSAAPAWTMSSPATATLHRQGRDAAQMGLWLLAEPPALRDAGAIARRGPRISQAPHPARQHRAGLVLLARGPMGQPRVRQETLPRSQGDGRRGPCPRRQCDDLGLAEILPEHGERQGARREGLPLPRQSRREAQGLGRPRLSQHRLRSLCGRSARRSISARSANGW